MTRAPRPSPDLRLDAIDDAVGRLHEAVAILDAIDAGDLLARLPQEAGAARRHQCAVSLLVTLRRELEGVIGELDAADYVGHALAQISTSREGR